MPMEFTYDQWRQQSKDLLVEADRFDKWRERTKHKLLTSIAPRVGKLSRQMYRGAGFHYSFEQQLANLINRLALPVQWDANHCAKIPGDRLSMIMLKVNASILFKSLRKAERSAAAWERKQNRRKS